MRLTKNGKEFVAEAILVRLYCGLGPKDGERYYSEDVEPASHLLRQLNLKPKEMVRAAVAASAVLSYDFGECDDHTEPMTFPHLYAYLTWCGDFDYAEAVETEVVAENARRLARGERPILRSTEEPPGDGPGGGEVPPSNVIDFAMYKTMFGERRKAEAA